MTIKLTSDETTHDRSDHAEPLRNHDGRGMSGTSLNLMHFRCTSTPNQSQLNQSPKLTQREGDDATN